MWAQVNDREWAGVPRIETPRKTWTGTKPYGCDPVTGWNRTQGHQGDAIILMYSRAEEEQRLLDNKNIVHE